MTQMIELIDKYIKSVTTTLSCMFKKLGENDMLSEQGEDFEKTQTECPNLMKTF